MRTRLYLHNTARRWRFHPGQLRSQAASHSDFQQQEAARRDLLRLREQRLAHAFAKWIAAGHKVIERGGPHATAWQLAWNCFASPTNLDPDYIGRHIANRVCAFGWAFALVPVTEMKSPSSRRPVNPARATWLRAYRHARLYNYGTLHCQFPRETAEAAKESACYQKGIHPQRRYYDVGTAPSNAERLACWKNYGWHFSWKHGGYREAKATWSLEDHEQAADRLHRQPAA